MKSVSFMTKGELPIVHIAITDGPRKAGSPYFSICSPRVELTIHNCGIVSLDNLCLRCFVSLTEGMREQAGNPLCCCIPIRGIKCVYHSYINNPIVPMTGRTGV